MIPHLVVPRSTYACTRSQSRDRACVPMGLRTCCRRWPNNEHRRHTSLTATARYHDNVTALHSHSSGTSFLAQMNVRQRPDD